MVYKLSPISSRWRETVLREFTDRKDGGWPIGGVILDSAGKVYGTTSSSYPGGGVVFELSGQ